MPANTSRGYTYPLYTDPADPAAQIQDFAQDVDADVTNLENRIAAARERPSARIGSVGNQAIATGVATTLTFTVSQYDNDSMFFAPGLLRLTDAGVYWLSSRFTFTAFGSGGTFGITAGLLSTAGFIPTSSRMSVRGHPTQSTHVSISSLHFHDGIGNDDITIQVLQESGNTLQCTNRNLFATKISALVGGS